MATRVKKVLAGIAALAALAFGAAAITQAGGGSQDQQSPAPATSEAAEPGESTAPENSAADPDNVQYEDENEQGKEAEGPEGSEAPESAEGPEGNEAGEEEGSEVPGDDGPGGHADEPANPNADHQFEGKE